MPSISILVRDDNMIEYFMSHLAVWQALRHDRRGVTAMEYGLIAALVAVVIIAALTTIGTDLKTKFGLISAALK